MRLPAALSPVTSSWKRRHQAPELRIAPGADDVESANRRFLLYGVMPLWFVPAVADWIMHRRSGIEDTAGTRESLIHALMMTEAGVPVVLGLTAEVNPLALSVMGGAAAAHGATALWDVKVATEAREVTVVEQHIHSFLEVLPLTAAAFAACLHWDQARRVFTGRRSPDDWRLRPKNPRLPTSYLVGLGVGVAVCVALPYGEELLRCLRADRRRREAGSEERHAEARAYDSPESAPAEPSNVVPIKRLPAGPA